MTNEPQDKIRPLRGPREQQRQEREDASAKIPFDEAAETGVLGCLLEDAAEVIPQIRGILAQDGADFYRQQHRITYQIALAMFDAGDPVNVATLPIEIARRGKTEEAGGTAYVMSLPNLIVSTYNAEYFARIVKDASVARKAIDMAAAIGGLGYDNPGANTILAEIDRLHEEMHKRVGTSGERRFGIMSDLELEQVRPSRGILGTWIRDQEIVAIYGATKSYKTFLAIAMGECWATGRDWFGMPVEQRTVLYIAAEAPGTIRDRLAAWKQHHGLTGQQTDFYTATQPINISAPDEVRAFIAEVRDCLPDAPGAIIIDTYACATSGDEKVAADVNAAYHGMRLLRDAFGATILYVDHEGKDRERGQTGSQRKMDNVDVQIQVERIEGNDGLVTVTPRKIKADESPSPLTLQTKRIPFYDSRTQEMRHSLVLLNTSKAVAQAASNEARSERLTRRQRQALDALTDLPEGRASHGDWWRACHGGDPKTFPKRTFEDSRAYLLKVRLVNLSDDIYVSLVRNKNRTSTTAPHRTSAVGAGGIYTPHHTAPRVASEAEFVHDMASEDGQTAPYHRHDPQTIRAQSDGITVCDACHPRTGRPHSA